MVAKPRNVRMAQIEPLKLSRVKQDDQPPVKLPGGPKVPAPPKPGALPDSYKAAPGRPESNVGRYLIKPTDKSDTGFEVLNADPTIIGQAHERYLKQYELPPALQPKYLRRPEVLDRSRRKEISKGWIKPRNQVL